MTYAGLPAPRLLIGGPCPMCGGSGHLPNAAELGAEMRVERRARKITLLEMSLRMEVSQPLLSDLELGKRRWTQAMIERYEKALNE